MRKHIYDILSQVSDLTYIGSYVRGKLSDYLYVSVYYLNLHRFITDFICVFVKLFS